MAGTRDRALELVALLEAGGVSAVDDVADALGKAPCVLVTPPRLELDGYAHWSATWSLVALASHDVGSAAAWLELDELVVEVAELLPVERATPSAYVLDPNAPSRPAYLLELSESIPTT